MADEEEIIIKETPRRRFIIIGVFIFALVFVIVLFSDYGIVNRVKLTLEINELKSKISQENKIKDSLNKEIKLLENDYLTIEKVARQKYGMIKMNEEVILILDSIPSQENVFGD